jgi:hypothetical protein
MISHSFRKLALPALFTLVLLKAFANRKMIRKKNGIANIRKSLEIFSMKILKQPIMKKDMFYKKIKDAVSRITISVWIYF